MTTSGIEILADRPGTGDPVERQQIYRMRIRMWLNRGDPVRWQHPSGPVDTARLEDDGAALVSDLRVDRENLVAGIFQGIDGMRVGGLRKLKISPHLAYGARGIPGIIPANAIVVAEVEIINQSRPVSGQSKNS